MMKHKEKETEENYKLFKTVREILHPTISKKNISNYQIVLDDNLLPVKVYYPKKISKLNKVIIYIQGNPEITGIDNNYSKISNTFSSDYDTLVISIGHSETNSDDIYKTFKHIYSGLIMNSIDKDNIMLLGDSTGATKIISMFNDMSSDNIEISESILFYPILSGDYLNKDNTDYNIEIINKIKSYFQNNFNKDIFTNQDILNNDITSINYPKTHIICGKIDPIIDELKKICELSKNVTLDTISFASHGFLNSSDSEITKEYKIVLNNIINPQE